MINFTYKIGKYENMKKDLGLQLFEESHKDIEGDFHISLLEKEFPIKYSPCKIEDCLVCICSDGEAKIEVDLRQYNIARNDIIIVFPGQILICEGKSDDFTISYFSFSNLLIDDILYRFPSGFIGFLRKSVKYNLSLEEKENILNEYFYILYTKFKDNNNICRSDIIANLLHNFYLDLYNKIVQTKKIHFQQKKRKQELLDEFFRLVKIYLQEREVAFYAEKLCITPKYLSIITKESTGKSAKDLISKLAITELKLQLKSSSTPLQQIAERLNYPNEAFLCKFFKKNTGITPSKYRNMHR